MVLKTIADLREFCNVFDDTCSGMAIDTETRGFEPLAEDAALLCIAIKPSNMDAVIIPWEHPDFDWGSDKRQAFNIICDILRTGIPKCGHNFKYDLRWLEHYFCDVVAVKYDTQILFRAWDSNLTDKRRGGVGAGLKELSMHLFGIDDWESELREYKKSYCKTRKITRTTTFTYDKIPLEMLATYAEKDVEYTYMLLQYVLPKMADEHMEQLKLFMNVDMEIMKVFKAAENRGICVDDKMLDAIENQLLEQIRKDTSVLYTYDGAAGTNINSWQQLRKLLYDKWKLPIQYTRDKKTGKDKISTDKLALENLRDLHPGVPYIIDIKNNSKQISMYVSNIRDGSKHDSRIHCTFNVLGAATGRASCSNPNMQQCSKLIKRVFVPDDGNIFVHGDFSQLELRIAANFSGDNSMIKTFMNRGDIHSETAATIYGVSVDEVDDSMRKVGKTMGFGMIYGMSPFSLSKKLRISENEAGTIYDNYMNRKPAVRQWIEEAKSFARVNGYSVTPFGRRRYYPEINSNDDKICSSEERRSVNTPIQSTGADICSTSMIEIAKRLPTDADIICSVHDSIVVECRIDEYKTIVSLMRDVCENTSRFTWWNQDIPIIFDIGTGYSLADIEDVVTVNNDSI